MNANATVESTALRYGLITTIGLIILFFIMKFMGWVHTIELRALNVFILAAGVIMALKAFKAIKPDSFTYLKGLGLGVLTGIWASIVFALFVFVYTNFIDPVFMQSIIDNEPFGQYLNPYIAAVAVAVEGIASGMIVAFITMNYMDTSGTM